MSLPAGSGGPGIPSGKLNSWRPPFAGVAAIETPIELQQVCPYCKGTLRPGWVQAWVRRGGLQWRSLGEPNRMFTGELLTPRTWLNPASLPAYRCENCRTVIARF